MRAGLAAAGSGVLAVGVILAVLATLQASQASAALVNCYGSYPYYGYTPACQDAMNAVALWQQVSSVGAMTGIAGFTLLVLGLVLRPENARPNLPYWAMYPPPVYAPQYPPPGSPPPQPPRTPPPGSP